MSHKRFRSFASYGPAGSESSTLAGGGSFSGSVATGTRHGPYRAGLKRALDIIVVLLAMPFVLPMIVLVAIAAMSDGGNPFYSQDRVGRGGRTFRMWKLRSMVQNADQALEAYLNGNPAARLEWDQYQKLRQDPRITKVGRFIRKTSIDELPQLFNVLVGEMSLVGPRPMMVEQKPLYPGSAYYMLRPGVTGYWQVSDRNDSAFADRAGFDTLYERDLSFSTDLRVIVRTVSVVIRASGH